MPETQLPATPPVYSPPSLGLEPLLDRSSALRATAVAELVTVRDMLGEAGAAKRVAAMALEMAGSNVEGRHGA